MGIDFRQSFTFLEFYAAAREIRLRRMTARYPPQMPPAPRRRNVRSSDRLVEVLSPTHRRPPRSHLSNTLSILVVDNNQDHADSLSDLLHLYGHGVQTVYDSVSALRIEPPDVVILELRLPVMDGWSWCGRCEGEWQTSSHSSLPSQLTMGGPGPREIERNGH